jgi:hypothetical protein
MRILSCTILTAALLGGTYTAVNWHRANQSVDGGLFSSTLAARRALEREVRIRAAMGNTALNPRGWPKTIDPAWFGLAPPRNAYIATGHPWVEVATAEQKDLLDPPIRQALTRDVASYWYNPSNGAIRARVGSSVTDAQAIDLYNRLNGSSITCLFAGEEQPTASATRDGRRSNPYLQHSKRPNGNSEGRAAQ